MEGHMTFHLESKIQNLNTMCHGNVGRGKIGNAIDL
jgi:hypothetical protein